MGKHDQKRLIRKLDLELFLSRIKFHPYPKASLEQYTVSEAVASTMLYFAAYGSCRGEAPYTFVTNPLTVAVVW